MKKRMRGIPVVILLVLLPCLPFILAFITYLIRYAAEPGPLRLAQLSDALYDALDIYSMSVASYSPDSVSALDRWGRFGRPLLELARWSALIAVAGAALTLLSRSLKRLGVSILSLNSGVFALHGDAAPVEKLKKELRFRAVRSDVPEKYNLRNHILAFRNADELYRCLDNHFEKMTRHRNTRLFIYTDAPIHSVRSNPGIIINNIAKNCARLYWKKHWLRPVEKKIVLIGNGQYLDQMLTQALQVNVFTDQRELEYHVFGDGGAYHDRHPQLEKLVSLNACAPDQDAVFFHDEGWLEQRALIREADRVIICFDEEKESLPIMDYMMENRMAQRIHIRMHNDKMVRALWRYTEDDRCSITSFGTDDELYTIDQITNATLNSRGMLIHAYYSRRNCPEAGRRSECGKLLANCTVCPHFADEWQKLSAYKRSSCIAQDDHSDVKIRELLGFGLEDVNGLGAEAYAAFCRLDAQGREAMIRLEHERWMRFLHLHGWSYGEHRDDNHLLHPLLVPFEALSDEEKAKDADAYVILGELDTHREYHSRLINRL